MPIQVDENSSWPDVCVVAVGTAYGDDQFLSPIFEKRMKERDALKSVVDAFDAVVPASHGTAAVDAPRDR